MNSDSASDRADLVLLRQGEDLALNRLIARWERRMFAFAWRYVQNSADARDLVADLFVRLYHQRLSLRPETNLPAWLFTTLANLCRNHHRWRRRHPTVSLDGAGGRENAGSVSPPELAATDLSPDAGLEHDETLDALAAAIERLPHELKVAVLLHHYERQSCREIGAVVGCSERGVETRLYRARQQLRLELAVHLHENARP